MSVTLKANVQNIETKLDVLDNASTTMMFNLAQIPKVMDASLNVEPVDLYRSTDYAFSVQSSMIIDTYTVTGFKYFYLYFPQKTCLIVSRMSFFDDVSYNTLDCLTIPENQWGVSTPYNHLISNPLIGKYMTERNLSRNYPAKNSNGEDIILTANVSEDYISQQLITGLQTKPGYAVVIDSSGHVLSSLSKTDIGASIPIYQNLLADIKDGSHSNKDYLEISIDGVPHIINWEYSAENDWYYITALDARIVTDSISSILDVMFIMIVCLLVLSIMITALLVRSTTQPLNELAEAMTEMKNKNFKVQINANHGNEYDVIYNGFNELAQELDSQMHSITEEKSLKTETYIRLLQSEINPHMLYNSLESLYSMAKINNQEDIATLVMALSKFFRISLSGGKRVVPFRDAFELAYQYIVVQNIRLNYSIKFEYDIPEDIMNILTPKFLLQPIVENAFQHGFKNKRENCHISINVTTNTDCVRIIVQDNGIGIHEPELKCLNEHTNIYDFEGEMPAKGYALRNLNFQLKLKYGERYGLSVESVYGEFTRVIICIPKQTEEE